MKQSKIYRKAAKLIARHNSSHVHACSALAITRGGTLLGTFSPVDIEFCEIFHAPKTSIDGYWLTDPNDFNSTCGGSPLGHQIRVLALLFMAEILESEGR